MKAGFMSFDNVVGKLLLGSLLAEMKKGCSYEFITHNYILVFKYLPSSKMLGSFYRLIRGM